MFCINEYILVLFLSAGIICMCLKSLFSFFSDYEIQRQIDILESGGEVENETRSFDAESKYVWGDCIHS